MMDEMRRLYVREYSERVRGSSVGAVDRGWAVVDRQGSLPDRRFPRSWSGRDTSQEDAIDLALADDFMELFHA